MLKNILLFKYNKIIKKRVDFIFPLSLIYIIKYIQNFSFLISYEKLPSPLVKNLKSISRYD